MSDIDTDNFPDSERGLVKKILASCLEGLSGASLSKRCEVPSFVIQAAAKELLKGGYLKIGQCGNGAYPFYITTPWPGKELLRLLIIEEAWEKCGG